MIGRAPPGEWLGHHLLKSFTFQRSTSRMCQQQFQKCYVYVLRKCVCLVSSLKMLAASEIYKKIIKISEKNMSTIYLEKIANKIIGQQHEFVCGICFLKKPFAYPSF